MHFAHARPWAILPGKRTDIAIIAGAGIGSAVALVKELDPSAEVCVIERDPGNEDASTSRASGWHRQLLSVPENIELSQYSIAFFEDVASAMAAVGQAVDIGLRKNGYLFSSRRPIAMSCTRTSRPSGGPDAPLPGSNRAVLPGELTAGRAGLAVISSRTGWPFPSRSSAGTSG